jgi:hypothetical protein
MRHHHAPAAVPGEAQRIKRLSASAGCSDSSRSSAISVSSLPPQQQQQIYCCQATANGSGGGEWLNRAACYNTLSINTSPAWLLGMHG